MARGDIYKEIHIFKIKIGIIFFVKYILFKTCFYDIPVKLFSKFCCTNKATKIYNLMLIYGRISKSSIYTYIGAYEFIHISRSPL